MRRLLLLAATCAVLASSAAGVEAAPTPTRRAIPGDADGNGYADLAIGARGELIGSADEAGAVHVLHGTSAGLTSAGDQLWHQDSEGIRDTAEEREWFGGAVEWGDFDGDGFSDLAAGVPTEDIGLISLAGAVHVLYGSPDGLTEEGDQLLHQDTPGIPDSAEDFDLFGVLLAAGQFGNGPEDDLAVGSAYEDLDGLPYAGAVTVLYGSPSGLVADGSQWWTQDSPNIKDQAEQGDFFGIVEAGDFNGDSLDDLAVGAPFEGLGAATEAGIVHVIFGSPAGLTSVGNQAWHQNRVGIVDAAEEGDAFGGSVAGGNFGNGPQDDLAIGVFDEELGPEQDSGAVHVIYGSPQGLTDQGDSIWGQGSPGVEGKPEEGDKFGLNLAAGNLGNGANDDLAVGVGHERVGGLEFAGAVNVLYGSPSGLTATGNQVWTHDTPELEGELTAFAYFGGELAIADFGRGTPADLAIGAHFYSVEGALSAGVVNVLYGTATGLTVADDQLWHQDVPRVEEFREEGDAFGIALA